MEGEDIDSHTLDWVNAINQPREAFMSPSQLDCRWMVRVSIGVEATTREHVQKLWNLIQTSVAQI